MGAVQRTPVAIIEPLEIMRRGLAEVVEHSEDFEVVFQADRAEDFLAWREQRARILIIKHPCVVNETCAITLLKAHFPHLRQLAWAHNGTPAGMRAASRSGAVGYLPTKAGSQEIISALVDIRIRGHYFHAPFLIPCVAGTVEGTGTERMGLTEQHIAILRLLAHPKEYSDAQIGDIVDLKPATVKSYRKQIHAALGVHSATAAVLKGIWSGLITLPEWD